MLTLSLVRVAQRYVTGTPLPILYIRVNVRGVMVTSMLNMTVGSDVNSSWNTAALLWPKTDTDDHANCPWEI